MKKFLTTVVALVLCLGVFTSCGSKYNALQKAFEKKGYELNTTFTGVSETIKEELNKKEYAVELHLLTKKSNGWTSALIIEFKSTKEMVEAYEDSETMKGLIKDIKNNEDVNQVYKSLENAGHAKGNCLVVPMSIKYVEEITEIVKSVK